MLRLLLLAFIWLPLGAVAAPSGDDAFLLARDAYRAGSQTKLAQAAPGVKGHVLQPYVEYWQLRMRLVEAAPGEVSDFLNRYEGSYVAELLRKDWLRMLGNHQQWELFEAAYPGLGSEDNEAACYNYQLRWRRGDDAAVDDARRMWNAARELPEGCVPIIEAQIAAGKLGTEQIWQRVRTLLEAGQTGAARRAMNYLPAAESPDDKQLDAAIKNPGRFLERADKLDLKKRANRELVLFALARVARNDPEDAAAAWTAKLQARFTPEDRAFVWAQLGTQGAKKHLEQAGQWFAQAGAATLTDEQAEWRVRAALRQQNWAEVRAAIDGMPQNLRDEPTWIYWKGRALRALGQREEADVLFARIAGEPQFYGKLALEELGRPLTIPPRGYVPTPEEIQAAAGNAGLRRAVALFRADMWIDAVREWNWSLRGMDDKQLLAAAEFARRNQMWDRAINAADRTRELHDYSLRFLAPYREVFAEQARAQALEEPWVLGLVRQESRFIASARSSAGAAGLMQLMPATARWMAKKIGMSNYQPARVTDVDINVALGTSYLRYVLDSLDDSPVLAAAAYNAGPGRARRWKADRPLEGAIYAETIPFNETRDYVKKVMSNTMYYAALHGGDTRSLKSRLGTIPPRQNGEGYSATITGQATVQ